MITNTSKWVLLFNSSDDGAIDPVITANSDQAPAPYSQWAVEYARQAAQDIAAARGTVVLPGESVILNHSLTNWFTVAVADVPIDATSRLADRLTALAVDRAITTGAPWFRRAENRVNLGTNIANCSEKMSQLWEQVTDTALVEALKTTAKETIGPCKTVYDTIKDFDTARTEPRTSPEWRQGLSRAEDFGRSFFTGLREVVENLHIGRLHLP
ncbi:hypothetical protein OG429_32320 [Streptomyces sp. NBC_00190]|uniref:hypothetical protein n=1 Tax=Streptomyces sp. NBC_00190 TaxID=2903634 RepID=UPI002E2A7908|nr:hypothetical protein [Streptomyces sp. NBC_00190]